MVIRGLSDSDARDLLESVVVGGIDPRVRDRIVAETRGIPLALVEVPRNVPAAELAGGSWNSAGRPSAGQIENGFVRRIQSLPERTQRLLLVAAAEPVGDAALFLRAAAQLGIPVDALGPAEVAGVIEFGPRMRFHHPLMRSASYRAADLVDRRAVHRALADATDPQSDPDRRAWHAANAAAGPDDAVAAELETSAGRAQNRGGIAAAAVFLERATVLTSDPAKRASRALEAARAAVGRAPKLDRPIDLLLSGMAERITGDVNADADPARAALELMCAQAHQNDGQALHWMTLGLAIVQESGAGELWDDAIYLQLATDVVRQARDAGALAVLPPALGYRAGVAVLAGEFTTAATLMDEAAAITAATGYAPLRYHSLTLAAWRGNPAEAAALIEAATADGTARGEGRVLGLTGYLSAVLYNGLGRYQEAFAAAREACEHVDLGFYGWCLYELAEAAARIGDRETAAQAVQRLERRAGASGTDWGLGALASAQALLADDELADSLFTEAIEHLERTRVVVHYARARLCYGEWLRRVNRRVDARGHLSAAHEMFTRMGAQAFGERARRELPATGA